MFTDFFQRTITDVGAIGPDRARGGLYLLLPPDHQGHVPAGYFVFKSATYNVFLFFRTVMKPGENGPDPTEPYSDTCRTYSSITRVYGVVKNHFPSSQATGKPRLYVGKFGHHTQVTL